MFLRTDGGLRTIRMSRTEFASHGLIELSHILRQSDVILLVDGLQLSMETTDDHILETVGLNLGPVLHLIRGNVFCIARHVIRRIGIGAFRTNGCHQFVVLIRDEILSSHLTDAVNTPIGDTTFLRVGQFTVLLVALFNVSQQWSLLRRVSHTELARPLEHDMLQVMGQARGLCRVVLRTRSYSDKRLYTRLFLVYTKVHLQTVIQRVDACRGKVTFYRLILVLLT